MTKKAGVPRTIMGNDKRKANSPSIAMLLQMAEIFNVSVGCLMGEGELSSYDKEVLKRFEDIERLEPNTKKHLFFLIDNVIRNFNTKKALA